MLSCCTRCAGNAAEKTRKLYQAKVDAINALEPAMQALSDEQLRGKTRELQGRYQDGETLDALLPEAFAVRSRCRPAMHAGRMDTHACMHACMHANRTLM